MIIKHSSHQYPEILISGDRQSLQELAELLAIGHGNIVGNTDSTPTLYSKYAQRLTIQHRPSQLVKFIISSDLEISVEGDIELLSIIGENINSFVEYRGHHMHIDYYEEHPYLDRDSIPVVIDWHVRSIS